MRLTNFFTSIKYANFFVSGCKHYNSCRFHPKNSAVISLKLYTCSIRNFITHHPVLHSLNQTLTTTNEKPSKKKKKETMVSVLVRDNVEKVMTLLQAEKFAKSKNCKLIKIDNPRNDKVKFTLQEEIKVFDGGDNKTKDRKNVLIREDISLHDLQIKLNSVTKFVEKGKGVLLVLDITKDKKKLDFILDCINNNSTLKDSLHHSIHRKTGVNIIFEKTLPKTKSEVKAENNNVEVESESDIVTNKEEK